jgi:hypothetical protein
MNERPILITGADRSGTSLMYALIGSHPDVAMIRRSNVWRWFDGAFGPLGEPANLDRCLDAIGRYRRMDVLQPDPDRLRREFGQGPATYGRLFALLFEHHAERLGRGRWGDKSLHTEHHADRVFEEWPAAKIVHMVRDPLDRHASVVKRYPDRSKGLGAITGGWLLSVDAAARNLATYPASYMVVRYETLALNPEQTVRQVCDFLDLEFAPEMMAMRGVSEQSEEGGNSSFGRFEPGIISTRSIGRFADVLAPETIAVIEAVTADGRAVHSYEASGVSLSTLRRIRVRSIDIPLARARVRSWIAAKAHADAGRGVPESRLDPVASPAGP